jgi:PLP dependent protein
MICWTLETTTTFPPSCAEDELRDRIASNLGDLQRRISSSGRSLDSVRIVAVTKTFPAAVVHAVAQVGLLDVGENYADELHDKRSENHDALTWHYLGHLQSNKIARIARDADVIEGVSRLKEIESLARANFHGTLFVQLDVTERDVRNGAPAGEIPMLVERARALELRVTGLMTVAPPDSRVAREAFEMVARLADDLGLAERSMGMSDDLELALAAGTTQIRVGRALVGERKI